MAKENPFKQTYSCIRRSTKAKLIKTNTENQEDKENEETATNSPSNKSHKTRKVGRPRLTSNSKLKSPRQPKRNKASKKALSMKLSPSVQRGGMNESLYRSLLADPLFGEGLKSETQCKGKSKGQKKNETGKQEGTVNRRGSDECSKASEVAKQSKRKVGVLTERNLFRLEKEVPSDKKEKVSDWLARSSTGSSDASIEIYRGEEQISAAERRTKLFPDEFFDNLHVFDSKPHSQPVKSPHSMGRERDLQEKTSAFLAKLRIDHPVPSHNLPTVSQHRQESDPVTEMEDGDLYMNCITGTLTTEAGHTDTDCITGTLTTEAGHTNTDCITGTLTMEAGHTDTETGTHTAVGSKITSYMDSNQYSSRTGSQEVRQLTTTPPTAVKKKAPFSSKTGRNFSRSSSSQIIIEVLPKPNKYMSSTMRKSLSMPGVFPSELSSIILTDSLKKQQHLERTPNRPTEFKLPGSPSKAAHKPQRKGLLEQKNSTKLFTTGHVEIVDVIPGQLSPISVQPESKSSGPAPQLLEKQNKEDGTNKENTLQVPTKTMKTSTPNKTLTVETEPHFDFDLSSVKMDTDDDELLHFNKSCHEVNSQEIINISQTYIAPLQDQQLGSKDKAVTAVISKSNISTRKQRKSLEQAGHINKVAAENTGHAVERTDPLRNVSSRKKLKRRVAVVNHQEEVLQRSSKLAMSRRPHRSIRQIRKPPVKTGQKRMSYRSKEPLLFPFDSQDSVFEPTKTCPELGLYKESGIPICSLMNTSFVCMRNDVSLYQYRQPLVTPPSGYFPVATQQLQPEREE